MTYQIRILTRSMTAAGCALLIAACGDNGGPSGTGGSGGGANTGSGGAGQPGGTGGEITATGGSSESGGQAGGSGGNGASGGSAGGQADGNDSGGAAGGSAGGAGGNGGSGGTGGSTDGQAGGGAGGGMMISNCVGNMVPTADPTKAGPFETVTEKNVGPLAGTVPDPLHGDMQSRFNVYRPKDLSSDGYCFPILLWSNGYTDQPEPEPPECTLPKCGHYATLLPQLASHGFVVVASLSSYTSQGTPMPSLVGLDWILEQAEDPTSPYYQHLDTSNIGAAGHSDGGNATFKMGSDPRITVLSTIAGAVPNPEIHQPTLLMCGDKDGAATCSGLGEHYGTITEYPAMLINNLAANHLTWSSQGITGPTIVGFVAWFRVHLMNDTANRDYFYGPTCTFCTDNRVTVMRNSLMVQ